MIIGSPIIWTPFCPVLSTLGDPILGEDAGLEHRITVQVIHGALNHCGSRSGIAGSTREALHAGTKHAVRLVTAITALANASA